MLRRGYLWLVLVLLSGLSLSATARANVLDDVKSAVADALDSTPEVAGYLLGALVVIVMMLVVVMVFHRADNMGLVVLLMGIVGSIFATLVGWWPVWTMIVLVIAFAALLLRLPGGGSDGLE